jgi:hypothetical protein
MLKVTRPGVVEVLIESLWDEDNRMIGNPALSRSKWENRQEDA